MILTDLYTISKLPGDKSKMRMDCTASTKSYNPMEALRNKRGELFLYVGDNTYTGKGERGKSDLALSRGDHITSICTTDATLPFWYGDFHKTSDALLMVHRGFSVTDGRVADGATIEIFVARGHRANRLNLYAMFCDGALDAEMAALRQRATPELPDVLY